MPKRQNVCLDFKRTLREKLDALPVNRKYKAFARHLENKYIDGRKPRDHLELANLALDHLLSRDDAKINVKTFQTCVNDMRTFLQGTPVVDKSTQGEGEPMIAVIRATRVSNKNKMYKYETSIVVRGIDPSITGKNIYMDRTVFNTAGDVHESEVFKADKARYRDLVQRVGNGVIDRRIGQDHLSWRWLVGNIEDSDSLAYMMGMESKSAVIEIVDVRPLSENPSFQPIYERTIRDAVNEKYMTTKFLRYEVDLVSPFLIKPHDDSPSSHLRESCFYKTIVSTHKTSFDKYHASLKIGDRRLDRLTPELVSRVCLGREYDGGELNMRVAQATRFFDRYGLGLRMYDPQGNELYKHIPKTFHSKIRPRVLDVVYKNNHVVPITDTKAFEQLIAQKGLGAGSLSDRYHFKTYGGENQSEVKRREIVLASNHDQMVHEVRRVLDVRGDCEGDFDIHVVWSGAGLNDLVLTYVRNGYTPAVQARTGVSITSMTLHNLEYRGHKVNIFVSVAGVSNGDEEIEVPSIETYKKYRALEAELMRTLINPDHLSGYKADTRAAFREYCVSIPTGAVVDEEDGNEECSVTGTPHVIDMCKHYASCLATARHLVSISPFDEFVLAEPGEELRRDRLYLVDILPGCTHPVYRMKDRTLMFYEELADLDNDVQHRVYAHMRLILHTNTRLPQLIHDVFDTTGPYTDIPIDMRKGLVNRAIGELGRKKNRRREAIVFRNEDDANMHMCGIKRGGVKHKIAEGVWLVKTCIEKDLVDGFVPINEMIKSMSRHHMVRLWRKLTSLGCRVVGFKTDAVYFEPRDVDVRQTALSALLGDGVGKAKYFRDDDCGYPRAPMSKKTTNKDVCVAVSPLASQTEVTRCTVDNVGEQMRPGTLVLGGAGCGKTHNTLHHVIGKYGCEKVLVVTAWNSQAKRATKEFGVAGITWHRLRGAKLDDTVRSGTHGYDVRDVAVIVIDEIMLFEHKKLVKLAAYMTAHPSIDFYATGDPQQLEAIGDVIDNARKLHMLTSPGLFGNALSLHVNLRLDKKDRERMATLLVALNASPSPHDFVAEHFADRFITLEQFRVLKLKRAITFYNATASALNREIHEYAYHSKHKLDKTKVIEDVRYYYGDELMCRKKTRTSEGLMHVNYTYTIRAMNKKVFTLRDSDHANYEVNADLISTHFALPYCSTVHSTQGDRVAEPYAIADYMSDHVTKNWLMSAITRCERLDDIYFLATPMHRAFKMEEMRRMVRGYRAQDRARSFEDRTGDVRVSHEWIDDEFQACGGQCKHCGCQMTFERHSRHRASVNRLDNARAHVVGNIEICCWGCNNTLQ